MALALGPQAEVISAPEAGFATLLGRLGSAAHDRCYQCGTCSAVCPLSQPERPFPRKELVWAQWGLRERLLSDPDVWLCHQCNLCNTYCPTDARPGDLMAAVRQYQIQHYVGPSLLARAASEPKLLPLVLVPGALLTLAILFFAVILPRGGLTFPPGRVLFESFIPRIYIEVGSLVSWGFALTVAAVGGVRFWRAMAGQAPARRGFFPSLGYSLLEVFRHNRFKACATPGVGRYHAHRGIFYGFLLLTLATTGAFVYTTVLPWLGVEYRSGELSLPLYDPVKIIGNVGGLAFLVGLTLVTYRRLTDRKQAGSSVYFDWFFIALLYVNLLTGFLLQGLRFAELRVPAYAFYLVHLVFVFTLFIYFPYSKFAHLLYRTLAMTYTDRAARTRR